MKNRIVSVSEKSAIIATFAVAVLAFAIPGFSVEDKFEWVPLEAHSNKAGGGYQEGLKAASVSFTKIPKATADASKFTMEYVIDLKKFSISNDGTNPVETSKGINQALRDAQANGANKVVFPKGTYLISESDPVVISNKNTIIDLNGSTFQINTNGEPKYSIIKIVYGAENLRLTNGTLKGDRDTHDYKTIAGTHEHGSGLSFESGSNLEVDHITACNMTGDGFVTQNGVPFKEPKRCLAVAVKNIEQGSFSESGQKENNEQKTRTIKPYELSMEEFGGEFEFGYIFGYMSYASVMDRNYQACFFDKDMKFLQKKTCLQFKKTAMPEGTKFIQLEFNQSEVKEAAKHGLCGAIVSTRPSIDVHFHHNVMLNNRRLGFAFCGGQRWIMEDNSFEGNGGTAPGYGIDFEDGWDFMQDIVFRNNKFKGNQRGDLVVCAGSEMIFEGNEFEKNVTTWGRTNNYTFQKNIFKGDVTFMTRTGIASMHDNRYENCGTLSVAFDTKGFNDGFVHKPGEPVKTLPLVFEKETLANVKRVIGTYINFSDCKVQNVRFIAGKDTRLVHFKNCEFSESSIQYEEKGPPVDVVLENCKGALKEEGSGVKRKVTSGK